MLIKEYIEVVKYKESLSEKYGRYLIAAKKLSSGEVILRDSPIVVGAAVFNDNSLCFACMRIVPKTDIINFKFTCENCRVAVFCSAACENFKNHHSIEECELFQLKNSKNELSQINISEISAILLPLRLWLIQKRDSELWKKILKLESHLETRKGTQVWKDREENVINILRKYKLVDEEDDNELLQQLCGILDVNSFELRSPGSLYESPVRGLYSEASLMAHDCRGNTHLTVDDKFQLTVFASVPIEEGEPILFHYTSALLGVVERREFLREGKYFECECDMCRDPGELGANLSSIVCPRCKKGFIQLGKLTAYPYTKEKIWKCSDCYKLFSGRLIRTTIDLATKKLSEINDDSCPKEVEILLKQMSLNFHKSHSLMLNIKQKLLAFYRKEVDCLNPQRKILQRMLELYKEALHVQEIIEPGISRLKGIILYEMHLLIELLANRDYISRQISADELASRLEETMQLLKRSLSMLLLEPATNPESLLAKKALEQYKMLRQNLEDVKALPPSEDSSKKLTELKKKRSKHLQ